MQPRSRLAALWSRGKAAPWSLFSTPWCPSTTQVLVVFRDGGGKEGPGQRLETSGDEVGLRAILLVLSEPLLGTCVHVED